MEVTFCYYKKTFYATIDNFVLIAKNSIKVTSTKRFE